MNKVSVKYFFLNLTLEPEFWNWDPFVAPDTTSHTADHWTKFFPGQIVKWKFLNLNLDLELLHWPWTQGLILAWDTPSYCADHWQVSLNPSCWTVIIIQTNIFCCPPTAHFGVSLIQPVFKNSTRVESTCSYEQTCVRPNS